MNTSNSECAGGQWGLSWVVVSGASRGLGAVICEVIAAHLNPGSVLLGLARSKQGLNDTKAKVKEVNPAVKFVSAAVDLSSSRQGDLEEVLKGAFDPAQDPPPTRAMVFHNAGSLKHLTYLSEMKDQAKITAYFEFNVSSVITLNALFLEAVSCHPTVPVTIVNISSLCATEAFKSWGLYCSAKAARDMVFRVMAAEEPQKRILNYAPGPLDTDMQMTARTETKDEEVKCTFNTMKQEGKLVQCSESANKLLAILMKDEFKSGAHVDYFDE